MRMLICIHSQGTHHERDPMIYKYRKEATARSHQLHDPKVSFDGAHWIVEDNQTQAQYDAEQSQRERAALSV